MAARLEEGRFEKIIFAYFLVCKGLSNDEVGVTRVAVLQEIRPGVGFKTGDVVKEMLGGGYCCRTTLWWWCGGVWWCSVGGLVIVVVVVLVVWRVVVGLMFLVVTLFFFVYPWI